MDSNENCIASLHSTIRSNTSQDTQAHGIIHALKHQAQSQSLVPTIKIKDRVESS